MRSGRFADEVGYKRYCFAQNAVFARAKKCHNRGTDSSSSVPHPQPSGRSSVRTIWGPHPDICPKRKNLRALSLRGLPVDIGSALPQLRKLKLAHADELRELPASVSALQHLTFLGVFDAPNLVSLPPDIGALSRLRELHLIRCKKLKHLPASLTQLTRLNQLAVSNCPIRSLCPTAAQFQQLRSLDLSGCAQLKALPWDVGEVKALRMLNVDECRRVKDIDGYVVPSSIYEV
ncbi:unnamed protein product [Closterium sp. Yama58-4]|nr:unnamed protein product [Closterium sp. Yama58-4]